MARSFGRWKKMHFVVFPGNKIGIRRVFAGVLWTPSTNIKQHKLHAELWN